MAGRTRPVNLKKPRAVVADERDLVIQTLRDRMQALEAERDEARHAIDMLTHALRRQGCCDGQSGAAL